MSTPPTVHDSDRMAGKECYHSQSLSTGSFDTQEEFEADLQRGYEKFALIIARHHAEERAAAEKVKTIGEKWMQLKRDSEKPHDFANPEPRNLVLHLAAEEQQLILALTALRAASQSPTEGKT